MPHLVSQSKQSPPKPSRKTGSLQWPFAAITLAPLLFLRGIYLAQLGQTGQQGRIADFITYWASGRLFLTGHAPYSPAQMLTLERSIDPAFARPQIMLCPPWNLPLFALFGSMPYQAAHLFWFALSIALDLLSAVGLWIYFGGSRSRLWVPLLIAATFIQMGAAEALGQITPLILACVTGFLLLTQRKHYFLAGLCLFGLGIKPQLLYLFFLAVLIWIIRERRWSALAGAVTLSAACMLGAATYNPHALNYFHSGYHAAIDTVCGIGGILRGIFGRQHSSLQYLPTVFGALWFAWYVRRRRAAWNWHRDLPILALVSVSTAAYAWYQDFILILPALIAVAARGAYRSSAALVCYLAVQIAILMAGGISVPWLYAGGLLWIPFYLYFNQAESEPATDSPLATEA